MTALAMIIGMIPMALGIGEGAEQNAPLGRAVIGGLLFATVSTLFFVPVVFAGVHDRARRAATRGACRAPGHAAPAPDVAEDLSRWPKHLHPLHADPAGAPADAAQRASVARGTRIVVVVVLLLLAVGAGRTVVSRMANARRSRGRTSPSSAVQYVKTTSSATSEARPDARAARHAAGLRAGADRGARERLPQALDTRTSAAASRRASCSPRSSRPRSTSSCRRPIAAREQTASSLALAKSTVERWEALRKKDVVSQQELDERRSGLAQARANLAAADANVERLRQLQAFKRVVGAVRRRHHAAQRRRRRPDRCRRRHRTTLFVLTQTDPLRVYVNVPQSYAQLVQAGPEGRSSRRRSCAARRSPARSRAPRRRSIRRRARCRSRSRCPTGTASLLPGAYVQVALPLAGQPRARRCRPTRCCSAARARASPPSTRRTACACSRSRSAATSAKRSRCSTASPPATGSSQSVRFARRRRPGRGRARTMTAARRARHGRRGQRARRCRDQGAGSLARGRRAGADRAVRRRDDRGDARRLRRRARLRRPAVDMPVAWKLEAPWREGTPDDAAPKGPWWQRFGDARLDALQAQALARSPTLALANARLAQARAVVAAASAGSGRSVNLNARGLRQRISANRPLTNYASPNFSTVQNDFDRGALGQLRGRSLRPRAAHDRRRAGQRRAVGGRPREHAAPARPPISRPPTSTCARSTSSSTCWRARSRCSAARSSSCRTRHDLGAASGLDVAQQQALLDTTLTQVDVLRRQRAPFEHAIATLTGTPAPSFSLAARHPRADAAGGAARRAVRRPRAPARRRFRRARDGGGQRADRRRQRRRSTRASRSAPTSATRAGCWRPCSDAPSAALVDRRVVHAAAVRRPAGSTPTSSSRAPATTPPSPTTGASC